MDFDGSDFDWAGLVDEAAQRGIVMRQRQADVIKQNDVGQVREFRVAIVGGGPGGLFTAWHLAAKAGPACRITIYEASNRLGGKIVTGNFAGIGLYEAGVAEIYDY